MNKTWKLMGAFAAGVLIGVGVVGFLAMSYLRKQAEYNRSNWIPVIVAATDIQARSPISRNDIRLEPFPKPLIADDAVMHSESVLGKRPSRLIRAKEQIRAADLGQ